MIVLNEVEISRLQEISDFDSDIALARHQEKIKALVGENTALDAAVTFYYTYHK